MTILGRSDKGQAPEDEAPVEEAPEEAVVPEPTPVARSRRWPLVACVVLAAAALVLALLGLQQHNALQAERDRDRQLRDVSARTVAALTSYDYQHLDDWKKAVLANLTGKFQTDFESSVAGFEQVYIAEHNRATGTVQGVWIGEVADGKATTVVLVQFTVTSLTGTHTLQPYVQLTLLKVNGRWRVDDGQLAIDTGGGASGTSDTTVPGTSVPAP